MTDTNRQISEERQQTPPQIPNHEPQPLNISPTPSKSIHRSKTVRNLNSAGNKMKGFFGKKKETKSKTDENPIPARPALSTSASYGPTTASNYTQQQQQQQFPPPPPVAVAHQKKGTENLFTPYITHIKFSIIFPFLFSFFLII